MPHVVNQAGIFLPMLLIVALTFAAILRMGAGRAAAMKSGMDPDFYRAHQGGAEPAATVVTVRHYNNLTELPTIFYPACITAFALGAVGTGTLVFAWGYAIARLLQSAIHLSSNNPAHRGGLFMLGAAMLLALWVNIGLKIFALM